MAWLLETLRDYPLDADQLTRLQGTPEWQDARAWGWVMESGELSGTGHRHAGGQHRGIIPTGL